ncbi:hypothetical protein [Aquisalibacillus elongatus]|nr:hypothetical protein [Aquisalibacillus elongatus]
MLPQFEGIPVNRMKEFVEQLVKETDLVIDQNILHEFLDDFFELGEF